MLRAGVQVFTLALGTVELVVPPLLVAAALAVVGIGARAVNVRGVGTGAVSSR